MTTFTVAGVSKLKGQFKIRYANDIMRVKVLEKNRHTDIDLIELPEAMPKRAIAQYLLDINFDDGRKEVRDAIAAGAAQDKVKPTAAPKKTPRSSPSMDAIAARARAVKVTPQIAAIPGMTPMGITPRSKESVESEDAPF